MDFPHLENATGFPWDNNPPDVYSQYRNVFDYTQWEAGTVVTLCTVPWDGERNVVEWETDAARDAWFNGLPDTLSVTLTVAARMNGDSIKVPLPFDVAGLYNYVWVEYPDAPVAGESDKSIHKWGFFIQGVDYHAPSTTALTLALDVWTTFRNRVTVKSVQLERGHWAVANSATVSDYLANPMAHTANLMDAENDTYTQTGSRLVLESVWNTGEQTAVINCGAVNPNGSWANGVPIAGRVLTSTNQPVGYMLGVPADSLAAFLNAASAGFIQGIKALWLIPTRFLTFDTEREVFGVKVRPVLSCTDEAVNLKLTATDFNYPTEAAAYTKLYTGQYASLTVRRTDGTTVDVPVDRLTNATQHRAVLTIDDTGARITTYLNGFGDSTNESYTVRRLGSVSQNISGDIMATLHAMPFPAYEVGLSNADATAWSKEYERAQARANAKTVYDNALASNSTALTNANASADTAYSNAAASAATAQTNANAAADTVKANADRSADTAYSNAADSAATAQTNANAAADTVKANTSRSTSNDVANNTAQNDYNKARQLVYNEYATEVTQDNARNQARLLGITVNDSELRGNGAGTYDSSMRGSTLQTLSANAQADWENQAALYTLNTQASTQTSNFIASAVNGGSGFAQAGAAAVQGDTASAVGNAIGAAVGLVTTAVNFTTQVSNNEGMQDQQRKYQVGDGVAYYFGGKTGIAYQNMLYQNQYQRANAFELTTESTAVSRALTDAEIVYHSIEVPNGGEIGTSKLIAGNNKTTTDSNASATQSTAKANSKRTHDTAVSNASATRSTSKTNNTATQTTAKANSKRTHDTAVSNAAGVRDTSKANANRTKTTADSNAKRTYDNALAAVTAGINTDSRVTPSVHGTASDSGAWARLPQGIQYRLNTPSNGDLARIAQRMNRYGYNCVRTVNKPALRVMPKWSYWKCTEAWVVPNGAPMFAVENVRNRLTNGVTVWSSPDMIGDVEQ